MGERNWFVEERRNTSRDGEYSFSDELMGNEETFATSPVPKLLGTLKRDWSPSYQGPYGETKKAASTESDWSTQLIHKIFNHYSYNYVFILRWWWWTAHSKINKFFNYAQRIIIWCQVVKRIKNFERDLKKKISIFRISFVAKCKEKKRIWRGISKNLRSQ